MVTHDDGLVLSTYTSIHYLADDFAVPPSGGGQQKWALGLSRILKLLVPNGIAIALQGLEEREGHVLSALCQ